MKNAKPEQSIQSRIVARARKLFLHTGFRNVTMDELAADLGMSKKTLYQNFRTKDELLRAVINQKFDEVELSLQKILAEKARPVPDLLAELLVSLQRQIMEIHPAFVRDVERSDPALFALINERRSNLIRKYFGEILDRGRRQGVVRRDIPVPILIEVLLANAQAIINPERLAKYKLSPQKAFSQVLNVFFHGILTEKARQ